MKTRSIAYVILGLWVLSGCSQQLIPNTDVEDNEFNRKVISFCEQYRRAVERRSVGLLMRMADPRYYEDGGNADATDDLDYEGLRAHLQTQFREAKAIRYEIRYRRVGRGRNAEVHVDYTYSASYKVPSKEGDVWRRAVADNRLELVAHKDGFRILSGM